MHLRYTLKGFERNCSLKIPSKQLIVKRFSFTLISSSVKPWFLSGIIDAEGSFTIIIDKNQIRKIGYRVQLRFRITQHKRDIKLMESIMLLLGSGNIYKYPKQSAINITIINSSDISNKIMLFL